MTETVTIQGSGLVFVNTYGSGVSAAFRTAIIAAENYFQSQFTNSVTLNMSFDLSSLGSKFSGQNSFSTVNVSYSQLRSALQSHAVTASDILAVNGLPSFDPTGGDGFDLPTGQARMLGLAQASSQNDDSVELNSDLSWTFGQDAIGVLEHEISEGAMGRIAGLGYGTSGWGTLDLFRFNASGQRDYSGGRDGVATYFGVDGAHVTSYMYHNSVSTSGVLDAYDLGDWDSTVGDAFGPGGPGSPGQVSSSDLQVMDVLGWTPTASSTPAIDDYANSRTDTSHPFGAVAVNGGATGTLEINGDRDWFIVQLVAGSTYTINIQGLHAGQGTLEDPYLRVHDAAGTLVAENDDIVQGINRDSRLSFKATTTGAYYIDAGAFNDSYTGTYLVSVSGPASPPPVPNLIADSFTFDGTTAHWRVANVGASSSASSSGVYLSTDAVITSADVPLTTFSDPSLGVSAFSNDSATVSMPSSFAPGTYYLGALANRDGAVSESSSADNGSNVQAVILGDGTNNTLTGGGAADIIFGMGGDDTLEGGAGGDTLNGGGGLDTASYAGAASAVTVNLGASGSQNTGGGGADTLTAIENLGGSVYGDTLTGDIGANVLSGRLGNDTLTGGSGSDTFIFAPGDGLDRIADFTAGGTNDSIDLTAYAHIGSFEQVLARAVQSGPDTILKLGGEDQVSLSGVTKSALTSADFTLSAALSPDFGSGADFNGDGTGDVLWRDNTGLLALWRLVPGSGAVSYAGIDTVGPSWHIQGAADFDGDGRADVLWRNDSGFVALWQSTPSGHYGYLGLGQVGLNWHVQATGDFNGDGKADVLWRDDSGLTAEWRSSPQGLVYAGVNQVNLNWHVQATADFNGDGLADILWRDDNGLVAEWLSQPGSTQVSYVGLNTVPPDWHILGAGDFNGDGKADILWRNDSGLVGLWQSIPGSSELPYVSLANVPLSWHMQAIGDFNEDGKADVLWRDDTGRTALWDSTPGGAISYQDLGVVAASWFIS